MKLIAPGLNYVDNQYFFLFTERGYNKYINRIVERVDRYNRIENVGLKDFGSKPEEYAQKHVVVYTLNSIPVDKIAYKDKMQVALAI